MKAAALALASLALGGCDSEPAPQAEEADTPAPPESDCHGAQFESVPLTVCVADPVRHRITLTVGPEGGEAYRSFARLAAARPAGAPKIAFAVNGGMFDQQGQPIGYYVEDGDRQHTLNRANGSGNFHLLPNGVFFGADGKWQVQSTEKFARSVKDRPQFGTQSGPMLVIDGKLHPRFSENGTSLYRRNGVGVGADGKAYFVISDAPISFGRFARYFRDELKTPNALYLDGSVSALWDPVMGRMDGLAPLGPLIVIERSEKGSP